MHTCMAEERMKEKGEGTFSAAGTATVLCLSLLNVCSIISNAMIYFIDSRHHVDCCCVSLCFVFC